MSSDHTSTMETVPEPTTTSQEDTSKNSTEEIKESIESATTAVSESDASTSDQETSESSETTSTANTSQEEEQQDLQDEPAEYEDDVLAEVRRTIATGMSDLSQKERAQITGEVHGINNMGLSLDEEMKPHVMAMALKQFQDALDRHLGTIGAPEVDVSAYELCLRNNYFYATNESGELRIMCLRAELWNPIKACERFLKHLSALYKYYGEDGLKQPLDIDFLDYEERNRPSGASKGKQQEKGKKGKSEKKGVYKKGKGGSKRKGSLDSLPDMLSLKSGSIQVLPSRDRSGRRVVILQPGPSIATSMQTQRQVQQSKFKAMFYFLYALIRRDEDAQRKGFVLILNSSKTDETHNDYDEELINEYKEFCQSIPVRFSAFHFAFDKDSTKSIPHKICMAILQSYIDTEPSTNVARIQLYNEDASTDRTKHKIAPFGIPTHQIPVTHTGTIKLKEHNGWVKIQEWYDKKCKTLPFHLFSKFNVIECPGTNDILFSQGGKYWNGVNRFQRGNLEFMEFLESKIDVYQSTLSWKKKHAILSEAVEEFALAPQSTGNRPRFLETATQIEGVAAPDGCWVELPLNSPLLMQKIRQTLLNHIRRLESSGKRKPAPTKATRAKGGTKKTKPKKKQQALESDDKSSSSEESPNKRRKMSLDSPHSVMKNNKLAIATFGNSITSSYPPFNKTNNNMDSLAHKQSICEFLANAERIAVSTTAVDIACENYDADGSGLDNLEDAIANDEKLVQAIIANDDRLNKEVGELFEMDSLLRDDEVTDEIDHDEIADCLMGCLL